MIHTSNMIQYDPTCSNIFPVTTAVHLGGPLPAAERCSRAAEVGVARAEPRGPGQLQSWSTQPADPGGCAEKVNEMLRSAPC